MDFGDLGRRCTRFTHVRGKTGKVVKRCAAFSDGMGADDLGDMDLGAFGDPSRDHIAGPLIGGGITQVGTLATKLIWKDKPVARWGSMIGLGLGGIVSGIMAARPKTRAAGISGLITAALVAIPRQIEDLLGAPGTMKDGLGVHTAERELAAADEAAWAEAEEMAQAEQEMMGGQVSQDVQLLDGGSGSTGVLGVITPEREMAGGGGFGAQDVELLGGGGFGSNFLSAQ